MVTIEEDEGCRNLIGRRMKPVRPPVLQIPWGRREMVEAHVDPGCCAEDIDRYHRLTPHDLMMIHTLKIECDTAPGLTPIDPLSMYLYPPDPAPDPGGENLHLITDHDPSRDQSAGDDRPETGHGENPVDGEAERTIGFPGGDGIGKTGELGDEEIHPLSGP
jgi:hypothetical protein